MRILLVSLAALGVTACGLSPEYQAMKAAEEKARQDAVNQADDAKCRSYGVQPGSQPYVACRINLEQSRANIAAAERIGLEAQQQAGYSAMIATGAQMMRGR